MYNHTFIISTYDFIVSVYITTLRCIGNSSLQSILQEEVFFLYFAATVYGIRGVLHMCIVDGVHRD